MTKQGYNDLPADWLPPNTQHILRINDGEPIEMDALELDSNDFLFHIHPFLQVQDVTLQVPAATKLQTSGLKLMEDDLYQRVYVQEFRANLCTDKSITKGKQ